MAKDKLTQYDSVASSNLDVGGISVAEGMLPSGVNNAIREQMSHLADFAAGTSGVDVLKLQDDTDTNSIKLQAPTSVTADTTFTLPDGDGTADQVLKTDGSGQLNWVAQTAVAANPSLIINGAMQVAQRGTSETNFTGSAFRTVDRVRSNLSGGGTFDQEQSTDVPSGQGFINSLKTTVNTVDSSIAASDYYGLEFPLEGQNVNSVSGFGTSGAKNLTLSFWVKSSVTGDYSVSFQNGVFDTSYVSKYTISSANTWEKKTISIAAKTDGTWVTTNAQGARIWFSLGTGSTFSTSNEQTYESGNYVNITGTTQWISNASATFFITGVKLEVGSTATDFVHQSFGDELARCQRYFQKSYEYGTAIGASTSVGCLQTRSSGTGWIAQSYLTTPLRGHPTTTSYSTDGTSGKIRDFSGGSNPSANIGADSESSINISASVGGDAHSAGAQWTVDAEL